MFVSDHLETKQQGLTNFLNVCWLLLTLLLAPAIQYSVLMVSLLNGKFWGSCYFLPVKRLILKLSQWRLYESSKIHVASVWLLSILFSRTALSIPFFPLRSRLKQHWLHKTSVRELLQHRKAFVGPPQAGQNMHWRQRSALLWLKGLHLPLTYSSQKSKQRGFCRPRQLLLVCKHLILLVPSFPR